MSSADDASKLRAVIVTGPPGTGKTSTMWALKILLQERDEPNAVIDVDYVRNAWPAPRDDYFNARLGRRNVGAMAETYREHGARWLVLADIIESSADVDAYAAVLPSWTITVVRLEVERKALVVRLNARETEESIAWYLERSEELQAIMVREHVGDIVINIAEETARAVAGQILLCVLER